MNPLSFLLTGFSPVADVIYSGEFCSTTQYGDAPDARYIHLLQSGCLSIACGQGETQIIDKPSVIFLPYACPHQLHAGVDHQAKLLCARVELGDTTNNLLINALPEIVVVAFDQSPLLAPALKLLFDEAANEYSARIAALNKLMEYFLILLFRHLIESDSFSGGILAGLADARLSRAIDGMHNKPQFPWTLETLAEQANMSRARFALHFRQTVGKTPMDYLTDWRLTLCQSLLKQGKPVKAVAAQVGYNSSAALTRVFTKKLGLSPSAFLSQN